MIKILTPLMLGSAILSASLLANHSHADTDDHHMANAGDHSKMMTDNHGNAAQTGHHGDMMGHQHGMGSMTGKPGKPENVSRTINVTADDSMRFMHEPLTIKDGETIKFVVTNKGAIAHEFSIATKDEHMEHGQMMINNPTMHHAPGGNVITIKPGETEALIWHFEEAFEVEAACNIPGHYQAGMHSPVQFAN